MSGALIYTHGDAGSRIPNTTELYFFITPKGFYVIYMDMYAVNLHEFRVFLKRVTNFIHLQIR